LLTDIRRYMVVESYGDSIFKQHRAYQTYCEWKSFTNIFDFGVGVCHS